MTFDGSYLRSLAGRRDKRAQTTAPFSFLNLENEITDTGHVLGGWTRRLDEENNLSVQAYWDHFSRLADNLPVRLRVDTYDVDFQHQFSLGDRQKIVYGVGYRYTDTFIGSSGRDGGFALTFQPSNGQFRLFSAFLQDQIDLVPEKLELTLGAKFEHNDFTASSCNRRPACSGRPAHDSPSGQPLPGPCGRPTCRKIVAEPPFYQAALPPSIPAPLPTAIFRPKN